MKIGKIELEFYDGLNDMPADKYHQFNFFIMAEAGIGSDIEGFYKRLQRIKSFAASGDAESVAKECDNIYSCVAAIAGNVNFGMSAFVPMIKTWNGQKYPFIPTEKVGEVLEILNKAGTPKSYLEEMIDSFKKKTDAEVKLYFPGLKSSTLGKALSAIKALSLAYVRELTEGVNLDNTIMELDNYLLSLDKPESFSGHEGLEAQMALRFNNACLALSKSMNMDPAKAPMMLFFSAIIRIKEQASKEESGQHKKGKR